MDNKTKIMRAAGVGRNTLAHFVDIIEADCKTVSNLVEELINEGLLKRKGDFYLDAITFELTDEALKKVRPLTEEDTKYSKYGLSGKDVDILAMMEGKAEPMGMKAIQDKSGLSPGEAISTITYLSEKGLIKDKGFFRRKVMISERGKSLLTEIKNIH